MGRVKTLTVSKAKSKAWEWFSKYIRQRGSVYGINWCFTCNANQSVKLLQAGHWLPGRHPSVLFDERNCHPQCYHCNIGLKGNPVVYYDKMLNVYGRKVCEELKRKDKELKQFKVYELVEIADKYKKKYEELLVLDKSID